MEGWEQGQHRYSNPTYEYYVPANPHEAKIDRYLSPPHEEIWISGPPRGSYNRTTEGNQPQERASRPLPSQERQGKRKNDANDEEEQEQKVPKSQHQRWITTYVRRAICGKELTEPLYTYPEPEVAIMSESWDQHASDLVEDQFLGNNLSMGMRAYQEQQTVNSSSKIRSTTRTYGNITPSSRAQQETR
jgi:hypothetical protein